MAVSEDVLGPAMGLPDLEALSTSGDASVKQKRDAVIHAIKHAWSGYETRAFGADEVRPISGSKNDWIGLGLTILDSSSGKRAQPMRQIGAPAAAPELQAPMAICDGRVDNAADAAADIAAVQDKMLQRRRKAEPKDVAGSDSDAD